MAPQPPAVPPSAQGEEMDAAARERFGRGARAEDGPLITGSATFTDDIGIPGQCHAAFVRAPIAHGRILAVETARAAAMPGVIDIVTGKDLEADSVGPIPPLSTVTGRNGKPFVAAAMPVLASERVRYVGEPIAMVVAETAHEAQDAAEAVGIRFETLPAFPNLASAMAANEPAIWPEAPGNVVLDWEDGDAAAVDAAFAGAAHVERVQLLDTRLAPSAMEPRAAIASWDAEAERYALIAPTQGVAVVRRILADAVFKVPPEKIHVVTKDVGGGFGMKVQTYPEYAALLYGARRVGRPIKWCASRLESFLSDTHGRDGILEGELALDSRGKFLALRVRTFVGIGAYTSTYASIITTNNTKNCLSSVYAIPEIHIVVKVVLTNAAPIGPYRGAGRPEAIYVIERLVDCAARSMNIDRAELRRRNFIPASAMPYKAPNGPVYDSGEFERVLTKALALAEWDGFPARRAAAERAKKLRGIGIGCFLEVAGGILDETVDLRFEGGAVALRTGAQALGQGHLSTFVPLVAGRLGIPPGSVRLVQGDSEQVPSGTPTVASRSTMMAGSATAQACDEAIRKGRDLAAHFLEADAVDIEFGEGEFRVSGTDRRIGLLEVAERARSASDLPDELSGGLDTKATFTSPQMTFPNGCHVCEVEIDPECGSVKVARYTAIDDVGNILHRTIVEGQIHGGVAQGLGQALGERVVYGDDGQLLTASFMDYAMPRATDVPGLTVAHHVAPCMTNPLGVKGAGESGVAGSLPSAVNAVLDALAGRGVRHLDLPLTPERVWQAIEHARRMT